MNPKDYKDKVVVHAKTGIEFVVVGGKKRQGEWFLRDDQGEEYLLDECQLLELSRAEFDVRKLQMCRSLEDLYSCQNLIGSERFQEAWLKLESNPVESAAVSVLYCADWHDFCQVTQLYGVTREQSAELNRQLREALKARGLDGRVKALYSTQQGEVS